MCSIDQVIEGLYLGDFTAAASIQTLQTNQITHILIVAAGLPQHFPDQFLYKQIPVYDMPTCSIIDYFPECNEFIDRAIEGGGRVFVHCAIGASRSATIVIAYLMYKQQYRWRDALQFVTTRHYETQPNFGFIDQLKQYESRLGQDGDFMKDSKCSCLIS
jgi:protein-tyrosine phosphatase